MNNSPPPSPADRLTDLSLRLSSGADAWGDGNQAWWIPEALIALIVGFIKEIAETLASLAALIRDGKLVPQPSSAPRHGSKRPARKAMAGQNRTAAPEPAAAAQSVPLAEPEMAAMPVASPSRTAWVEPPAAAQTSKPQAGSGLAAAHWPRARPSPKTAYTTPMPWHVHFVTITK